MKISVSDNRVCHSFDLGREDVDAVLCAALANVTFREVQGVAD